MTFATEVKAAEVKVESFLKVAEKDVLLAVSKAGTVLPILGGAAKVAADVTGNSSIDPVIDAWVNKIAVLCSGAGAMVNAAQGSGSGADKAAAVASVLNTTIKNSTLVSATGIADENKYSDAVLALAGAAGQLFDSLKPAAAPASAAVPAPVSLASSQA